MRPAADRARRHEQRRPQVQGEGLYNSSLLESIFPKAPMGRSSPSKGQGRVQRSPSRSPDRFEARAGSVLAMHRLLLYALAAMNGGPFSSDPVVQEDYISPLPDALRRSLMAVHASGRSKHSASPWRPEMDAFVLLRHVRDGISLPKVAEQWPFESATKRGKDAI